MNLVDQLGLILILLIIIILIIFVSSYVFGYNQTEYYICGPLDDKVCVLGDKW